MISQDNGVRYSINQLDTPDDISSKFDLSSVEGYERKIDNTKYYDHDKGDFGEEVAKKSQ